MWCCTHKNVNWNIVRMALATFVIDLNERFVIVELMVVEEFNYLHHNFETKSPHQLVVDLLEVDDYDLLVIHNYELVVHLHN